MRRTSRTIFFLGSRTTEYESGRAHTETMERYRLWRKKRKAARRPLPETTRAPTLPDPQPPRDKDPVPPETSPPVPPFPDGVKVLYDCPDATVDICFVHGLTGGL